MAGRVGYEAPPPSVAAYGQVVVISQQFCVPHPIDMTVTQKFMTLGDDFVVTDVNGNEVMKVKGKVLTLRDRRTLFDASGNPIATMHAKVLSVHRTWEVFRGLSKDPKDLLFVLKKPSVLQSNTELDVFLASNTAQEVCDFKIKGNYYKGSCTISLGNSNAIIAQMNEKNKFKNKILGTDTYGITVYPNVDYAFVISLIVILDQIYDEREEIKVVSSTVEVVSTGLAIAASLVL